MNEHTWTAIFLFKGVSENVADMKNTIDGLLSAHINRNILIIVFIHAQAEFLSAEDYPRPANSVATGWTTLCYKIEVENGRNYLVLLGEDNGCDLRDEESVTNFFGTVLFPFLTDECMIFTWDHGQPFGIFKGEGVTEIKNPDNPLVTRFRLWEAYPKAHEGLKKLMTSYAAEILTIAELRRAIELGFRGKTVGLLAMSNCYLQFFDTGYELSGCVEYLVAFETHMYFTDTFDYRLLLETAANNPGIKPRDLSKLLVNAFKSKVAECKVNSSKSEVALVANDLSLYPCLASHIDQLSEILRNGIPKYAPDIKRAVDRCAPLAPEVRMFALVDFKNFVIRLREEVPVLLTQELYDDILATIDRTVVEKFIGDSFKNETAAPFKSPGSFTIYLPDKTSLYSSPFMQLFMDEASTDATAFVRNFSWDAFIARYMDYLATLPEDDFFGDHDPD